ncbi:MAG: integrase [Candidatus Accumulibacter sp. BA-94]|nr:MAG: integrase [Candidatus Accumulibacter sp. BA-94]
MIDSQLSHRERSAVLGAYVHMAEYAEERRRMMQHWADYVDNLEHGRNVVPLKKTVARRRAVDAA